MKADVVVLGLGAAGLWAAREALEFSKGLSVLVVDRRIGYDTYSPCALPFALAGEVNLEDIKHTLPSLPRLRKMMGYEITGVDPEGKKVHLKGPGGNMEVEYTSCIIATGSSPALPPVKNLAEGLGRGVYTVSTPEDLQGILQAVDGGAKRAVVLGCGVVGMEVSHALRKKGVDVTCIEVLPYPLQGLMDSDMVMKVIEHLREEGIDVRLGAGVEEVDLKGEVKEVLVDGEVIQCDMVVVATGVRPNTAFLEGSGIELEGGHIVVDEMMRTSHPGVYAAGDVVTAPYPLPPGRKPTALASTAYIQGKVAGRNAAREIMDNEPEPLPPSTHIFSARIGALEVAATGMDLKSAKEHFEGSFAVKIRGRSLPEYFPGGEDITLKLIVAGDGRVLGGQIIGGRGTFWRINLLGWAVTQGMSVEELSLREMAYTPPLSDMYDILSHAADRARAKLRRRVMRG